MKPINGMQGQVIKSNAMPPVPVGNYVAKIMNAKVEPKTFPSGDTVEELVIQLDISEGAYKGYYKKMYEATAGSQYGQKWKGVHRLRVPEDNPNNEGAKWTYRQFANFIGCIEDSNPGYRWTWDEKSLKGLAIGIKVREFEWETDTGAGISTEIGALCTVTDAKDPNVKNMKRRELKNKTAAAAAPAPAQATLTPVEIPEDEIPF